jgi:hypothetical protein
MGPEMRMDSSLEFDFRERAHEIRRDRAVDVDHCSQKGIWLTGLMSYLGFLFALRSCHNSSPYSNPSANTSLAPNPRRADDNVIIPEGVGVPAVRFPAKVDGRGTRPDAAPLPLVGIRVADSGAVPQAGDGSVVEPCLNGPIGANLVLEAHPLVRGELSGGSNTLRREFRESSVVLLAVPHQDPVLAADAEVLLGALGRVWHGDEGDMGVGEGTRGLTGTG